LIAKRLKALRAAANKTYKQVAKDIGVAESTYREWEQGRQIRGEPYQALANSLNSSISYILTGQTNAAADELARAEEIIRNVRLML
jgi:transcriptional regulator with XRE-family HTH domain